MLPKIIKNAAKLLQNAPRKGLGGVFGAIVVPRRDFKRIWYDFGRIWPPFWRSKSSQNRSKNKAFFHIDFYIHFLPIFGWILKLFSPDSWPKNAPFPKHADLWKWAFRIHETIIFKGRDLQKPSQDTLKNHENRSCVSGRTFCWFLIDFDLTFWSILDEKIDPKKHSKNKKEKYRKSFPP